MSLGILTAHIPGNERIARDVDLGIMISILKGVGEKL